MPSPRTIPYGYKADGSEKREEQEVIRAIREMKKKQRMSARSIARALTSQRIPTPHRERKWSHQTVLTLLTRKRPAAKKHEEVSARRERPYTRSLDRIGRQLRRAERKRKVTEVKKRQLEREKKGLQPLGRPTKKAEQPPPVKPAWIDYDLKQLSEEEFFALMEEERAAVEGADDSSLKSHDVS